MNAHLKETSAFLLLLGAGGIIAFGLLSNAPQKKENEIAGFATSLRGRTGSQRHNAQLAALALDGQKILPGTTFSFNRVVKSWSWDQGYVKAPVSYDGELVRAYGGGVCQTSTTLYNAALLAGMPIVERHPHVFAPRYVPPGRDAAVAQPDIDLRFRNPYDAPVRIQARAEGDRLEIRLISTAQRQETPQITTEILAASPPARLTRILHNPQSKTDRSNASLIRNPGAVGCRVVSYRTFFANGTETRRERLADDDYQAMDRVVSLADDEQP